MDAKCITESYRFVTSEAGAKAIVNGFKSDGIYNMIQKVRSELPSIGPFDEISPLVMLFSKFSQLQLDLDEELRENYVNQRRKDDDEDSEWGDDDQDDDDDDGDDDEHFYFVRTRIYKVIYV